MHTPSSNRGFTLLELLISLALLSIIFAFITGALSFTHKAWIISNQVSNKAPESVVQNFLRKHIAAAIPMRRRGTGPNVELVFKGEEKRLEFITEMQERGVKAGLYRMVLFLDKEELKVSIYPYHPAQKGGELLETRALLGSVKSLEFSYDKSRQTNWDKKDKLPALIAVKILKTDERILSLMQVNLELQ